MPVFTGQKPDDGWSNLDVVVWTVLVVVFTAIITALLVALF